MSSDLRLLSPRFPKASRYNPEWVLAGVSGGANPLWLTEWLVENVPLEPGMKVLDLGCGRGLSSLFLYREFGVQVWATDLWFSPFENMERVRDAGAQGGVFPIRADARSLPFSEDFFDVILSIDSFMYYGTDDLYLNYLTRFVKPHGWIAIAQSGLMDEFGDQLPDHLSDFPAEEIPNSLHSAAWWRRHWTKSGLIEVELADSLVDGWQYWRDWLKLVAPENEHEQRMIETDAGRSFAYVRVIGRRRENAPMFDPQMSIPANYTQKPILRS